MATIKGFVIAGNEENHYLHRTGSWVKYDSPAKAYVWTKEEVDSILKEFSKVDNGIAPKSVIPATFIQPSGGITTIEGNGMDAENFNSALRVSGEVFNPDSFRSTYNLVAGSHSL